MAVDDVSDNFSVPSAPRESDEVCITGIGVATCLGLDIETVWRRVKAGECGIGAMPALESPLPANGEGGQAPDLPSDFAPELTREARYLRWTIDAALRDAQSQRPLPDAPRVALLLGTTLHGMRAGGQFLRTGDYAHLHAFLAGDVIRLATRGLAIGGLCATTCSACSSSLGAIAMAVTLLESREADLVIAGGYDAVSEYAYAGFGSLRLISEGPLRPFGLGRAGMKVSEGYGVLVLERRRNAEARGVPIRATIAGWGESADAFHLTRPHPEGAGALAAMRQAVERVGIRPDELDLIAAHATGTVENDNSEAAAIASLLGERSSAVPVVGLKSHLGHTLGGAGAVELALSAMAIRDKTIPPTANCGEIEFSAINVSRAAISREIHHTLNTSLGFGGANTCIVLRSPDSTLPQKTTRSRTGGRSVAITGVGVLLPGATGNDAFLAALRERREIASRTIADAEFESLVPNARRLRRMSPYVKLSIAASTMAVRDAGLMDASDLLHASGAILGTTHGSAGYCHEYYGQVVREGMAAANPMLFADGVPNAAAAQLSLTLGLTDACQTILGTRTAGLDALRLAAMRIAAGEADRLVVCAAEESDAILDAAYHACGAKPSLSLAVAFVLEAEDVARDRGATIRATIGRGASVHRLDEELTTGLGRRVIAPLKELTRAGDPPLSFTGDPFSVSPLLSLAAWTLDGERSRADSDHVAIASVAPDLATAVEVSRSRT